MVASVSHIVPPLPKRLCVCRAGTSALFMWVALLLAPGIATASELQSLLLSLNESGLQIERQLRPVDESGPDRIDASATGQDNLRLALRRAVVGKSASNDSPGSPTAHWYSADGELLATTRFNDPRFLRAPQLGNLVHEAITTNDAVRFLLKGPVDASSVEVVLPDISGTILVNRGVARSVVNPIASDSLENRQGLDSAPAPALSRQHWTFDL